MSDITIAAVDWSGARGESKPHAGIWITVRRGADVLIDRGGWSRADAVAFVATLPPPLVAGFDFSFGIPEWFARELECLTIDDVWNRARQDGDEWLAPTPPFWTTRCPLPLDRRFRACEQRLRQRGYAPKSVFQLVGNGQVGRGSVRGMPYLAQLRDSGFAIWPFDHPKERLAIEMYPSLLRKCFPQYDDASAPTTDARDARASARAMQTRADELLALFATADPTTRIEGDVWVPTSS
jgi:hypothetical protein